MPWGSTHQPQSHEGRSLSFKSWRRAKDGKIEDSMGDFEEDEEQIHNNNQSSSKEFLSDIDVGAIFNTSPPDGVGRGHARHREINSMEWLVPLNEDEVSGQTQTDDSIYDEFQSSSLQDLPYDCTPFFGNKVVNQNKIDALRETEMVEHCLIFHRDREHNWSTFRPDLELHCLDANHEPARKQDKVSKRSLQGTHGFIRSNEAGPSSTPRPLHKMSRLYNNATAELDKFWTNSPLLTSLDRESLQLLSSTISHELLQIDRSFLHRSERQKRQELTRHNKARLEEDPSALQRACHQIRDQLSWSQRSSNRSRYPQKVSQ